MAKTSSKQSLSSNKPPFPRMRRVRQWTSFYCGPATLQMLLLQHGVYIPQQRLVEAAAVKRRIKRYGMTIEELAKAVGRLAPQYRFWFKKNAKVGEVAKVIRSYGHPVGVEWQGVFGKYSDGDDGHFSVVTAVDLRKKKVRLADPFRVFAGRDRKFELREFETRWWDENIRVDSLGRKRYYKEHNMMFVITSKDSDFPKLLNMRIG